MPAHPAGVQRRAGAGDLAPLRLRPVVPSPGRVALRAERLARASSGVTATTTASHIGGNQATNGAGISSGGTLVVERQLSLGQLVAGVAHEINNPLGVVLLYAHALLEEHGEKDELREDLSMVVEQADRCKKIVSGLLNFARRNKVARQLVPIAELVDRCAATLILPPTILIRTEHRVPGLSAEVDPDQIVQVITNLVSNSVDAMSDGGVVTITTDGTDDELQFVIADTGHGIDAVNIGRIFEPFYTTKQIGKGTGLGLAVTYGIIKMHAGSIEVDSNSDPEQGPTGTRFCVKLPLRAKEEPACAILEDENE